MKYIAIKSHASEFPAPIQLKAGDSFLVGERYAGPESWSDWYLCTAPGQEPGWVPSPVFVLQDDGSGIASMDYTAQEMNVEEGESVEGERSLNGWVWCTCAAGDRDGWVPAENLKPLSD